MKTTQLKVTGMNCGACVNHVTNALQGVTGVQNATVDLAAGSATMQHDASTNPATLVEAVAEAGYQAHRVGDEEEAVKTDGEVIYACPMHPWITSPDPTATCSICGMKLTRGD